MSTDRNPFAALKSAAIAFFKHDVVIQRDESGVRLTLAQRVDGVIVAPPPSRSELAQRRAREELESARLELGSLLDADPDLRARAHPLLEIEQALGEHGWKALDWVSLHTLDAALEEFESLVTNWAPTGLACLRSKMAVALAQRETQEAQTEPALMPHGPGSPALKAVPPPAAAAASPPEAAARPAAPAAADSDAPDAALLAAYAAFGVGLEPAAQPVHEVDLPL